MGDFIDVHYCYTIPCDAGRAAPEPKGLEDVITKGSEVAQPGNHRDA